MADQMVLETQQWLNKTYGGIAGFGSVPENGKTGWTTTNALIRATQIELGITNLVDNFGPTTSQYWDSKFAGALVPGFNHNVVKIIEGGFWAKGINPEDFTGQFSTHTQQAIIELKSDAGISDTSAVADSTFMAMLLTMDQFVLVPGGDSNVRKIQRTLNHDYQDYTGVMPADGIYQRGTNEALIYALQAAEGMGAGTANGVYGPGTISGTPTIGVGATGAFVRVLQWGLYVNGYNQKAVFDGVYSSYIGSQVSAFRSFMALGGGTSADLDVFKGLLTSNGNVNRDVDGFDTSTQLTAANAKMLANAGFKYAGRYLTGSAGTHASGTYHEKGLSRDELKNLFNAGLKVFLIYQDGASNEQAYFTSANGWADLEEARGAILDLGIPSGATIYFAVDADIQDGDIAGTVLPYFKIIHSGLAEIGYKTGIYGTRNVAQTTIDAGYASTAFVSDMSTGFSGNLGFKMPNKWAFDQIVETTFGGIGVDMDAASSRAQTISSINAGSGSSKNDVAMSIANNQFRELDSKLPGLNLSEIEISKTVTSGEYPIGLGKVEYKVGIGSTVSTGGNPFTSVTYDTSSGAFAYKGSSAEFTNIIAGKNEALLNAQSAADTISNVVDSTVTITPALSENGSIGFVISYKEEAKKSNDGTEYANYIDVEITVTYNKLDGTGTMIPEYNAEVAAIATRAFQVVEVLALLVAVCAVPATAPAAVPVLGKLVGA